MLFLRVNWSSSAKASGSTSDILAAYSGWGAVHSSGSTLQGKLHIYIPFLGTVRPQSQFPHSCVCEIFIYSQDQSTYFPAAEWADRSWKYINLSQIYECRNWETEYYNSVLEIIVSFLGKFKWKPDIYIGFSPALHLQCTYGFAPGGPFVQLAFYSSSSAGNSSKETREWIQPLFWQPCQPWLAHLANLACKL